MYTNIFRLNRGSMFRKGISMYFANYFDLKHEKERFIIYFNKIDKDNDGLLSLDEITDAYSYKVFSFLLSNVFLFVVSL